MVRTGMRISEQSAVTDVELPAGPGTAAGFRRFWLPEAIAKGRPARWVHVCCSVVRDRTDHREVRAEVIAGAQAAGPYRRIRRPLVNADPSTVSFRVDFGVQRSGDIGSPRSSGSTSASSAGRSLGSSSAAFFRPPPE